MWFVKPCWVQPNMSTRRYKAATLQRSKRSPRSYWEASTPRMSLIGMAGALLPRENADDPYLEKSGVNMYASIQDFVKR